MLVSGADCAVVLPFNLKTQGKLVDLDIKRLACTVSELGHQVLPEAVVAPASLVVFVHTTRDDQGDAYSAWLRNTDHMAVAQQKQRSA